MWFVLFGKGRNVCFVAGTMVLTDNGQVPIEDIGAGDYVYATDIETGESGCKQVVQTFENETTELVRVTYEVAEIVATTTHPFYVPQKGWTEAINLRAGDILVICNGEYIVVEKNQHEILDLRLGTTIHIMCRQMQMRLLQAF